ncbi:LolA-related protein [Pseudoxanthomonas sp.]|uniref:LolA-related protein n=1 Tax=Pseudoxanthomonas sp. TaxID=1871049 RepID=UPI00261D0D0B|nr:LolA-related protein [Pseudoxanthomonas sp.]WDS35411.1 MAG: fatty acyl CoA synthetase [Pseudoxanthomonas sp.]
MLTLLCSAGPLSAASPESTAGQQADPAWILSKIARPGAITTQFVELRGSALLKTPLRVEGRYARDADATLVREVTAPYHEKITLKGDQATLERDGKKPRTFSLSRAPELADLQRGFGALLSGDATELEQHYALSAAGTHQAWQLKLDPRDAAAAKAPVRDIQLYGKGAELRCIETTSDKGEVQRTLLAGAAQAAAKVSEADALTALCRGHNG